MFYVICFGIFQKHHSAYKLNSSIYLVYAWQYANGFLS